MPFEVGHTINQGRTKPRLVHEALTKEVIQNPAKLQAAVAAILDQAANGDLPALDWIACRLEGKPVPTDPDTGDAVPIQAIRLIVVEHQPQPQPIPPQPIPIDATHEHLS